MKDRLLMHIQDVFFTTPIFGFPPAGGPELRILNTIKVLAMNTNITVQIRRAVTEEEKNLFDRELRALGCHSVLFTKIRAKRETDRRSFVPHFHAIQNRLFRFDDRRALNQMQLHISLSDDVILWFGYGNISYPLIQKCRYASPNVKIVCDTDSVWSRFLLRGVPYTNSALGKLRLYKNGWKKQVEERKLVSLSTITTAVSDVDADFYRSISKKNNSVWKVSNVIDPGDYELRDNSISKLPGKSVCLVGTFGHPASPMDVAAKWLLNEVWPLVLIGEPEAHLYIVGKDSDVMWRSSESKTIHVTGFVPSTAPFIKNCGAIVVPLFFESGTRFKILEAGAYSRPVISTSLGAEGLAVTNGYDILIADQPDTFAEAIITSIRGNMGTALGKNLRELVMRDYTLNNLDVEIDKVLAHLSAASVEG